MKKPVFKRKEIIVAMPESQGLSMATNLCEGEILYCGSKVEDYKVGDKIVFQRNIGMEVNFFQQRLWRIENEMQVLCGLSEE
jgi:hypothetical protein